MLAAAACWKSQTTKPTRQGTVYSDTGLAPSQAADLENQTHQLRFAELALAEKEKQIGEMFERLDAAKLYAKNARRLQEIASRRFEELFHGIPIACFTCDRDGVVYECSRSAEVLWGVESHEALQHNLADLMTCEDGSALLKQLLERSAAGETISREEFEIQVKGREKRWVLANVFPLCDSDGAITGSVWAVVDDTDRKRQADRLQENESRFRISLEAMQSGVMIFDDHGRLRVANPRATEILGWDAYELMSSTNWYEKLQPIDREYNPIPPDQLPLNRSLKRQEASHDLTLGLRRSSGEVVWISVNSAPLMSPERVTGAVISFADITMQLANERTIQESIEQIQQDRLLLGQQAQELAEANRQLKALASTDGLTGLKNQRSYHEFLSNQHYNASRYEQPLSLLSLDVDFFKAFNDAFGHPAGDVVLKQVGAILTYQARAGDYVARSGGEEFAVVLPNTDSQGALEAAERIRHAIETAEWNLRPVTVSIGVSSLKKPAQTEQELIEEADRALYESKRTGRNRVTHSNELRKAA